MKVIFRVDGGNLIGLGHIMRCIAMAEMIRDSFDIVFIVQDPSNNVKEIIENECYNVEILEKTINYHEDALNFTKYLKRSTSKNVVVLDGYNFHTFYQKSIAKYCYKIISIDDLIEWDQDVDIVINHCGGIQKNSYTTTKNTQILLGTKYALVRKVFLEFRLKNNIIHINHDKNISVMICLGGADINNLSLKIVSLLTKLNKFNKIKVILGAANVHEKSFIYYTAQGVEVVKNLTAEKMLDVIANSDVAIVSCSTVSYEVATVGKPFVCITTAENQHKLRDYYLEQKVVLGVLNPEFTEIELSSCLDKSEEEIRQIIAKQRKLFDGRVATRINKVFKALQFA